jgi:hypothetical protein
MYSIILSKLNMFSWLRRDRSVRPTQYPVDREPNNSIITLNTTTNNNANQIDILIICKLKIIFCFRRLDPK